MAVEFMDILSKPIKITGINIDPRYFKDNGDGTYSATSILVYNTARDAMNFFKDKICKLDTECAYHKEETIVSEDDWEQKLLEGRHKIKYANQIAELERRKREWREAHPEKCVVKAPDIDNGNEDEKRYFAGYHADITMSLNEAIQNYLAAYSVAKDKDFKASLPHVPSGKLNVLAEFKPEYDALIEKWSKELGIPDIPKTTLTKAKIKTTIGQARTLSKFVPADATLIETYLNGLVEYLTTSTAADFKKNRVELLTFIDGEFLASFDNARTLKMSALLDRTPDGKESAREISIHTKTTDDMNSEKIITINKENPTDINYTFTFRAPGEGGMSDIHFDHTISTKADLRKALEMVKTVTETLPMFNKYVSDIDEVIDTL